jgi:DNA primase
MSLVTLEEALSTGRGTERAFSCPEHKDTNPSASVNVLKGVWVCYVCAAHGTVKDHVPTVDEALAVLAGSTPPRVLPEVWLDIFDADHSSPYWTKRYGFDVASANRCGTDPETGAPTYPLRDSEGRVLGVVSRHEDLKPKYRYPWNTSTSRTLYGSLKPATVVVVVEGASDVMALEAAGLPPTWVARGCFGSGLHYPQVSLVAAHNPKVVIAGFDDDKAGRPANARAVHQLADIAPVVSVPWSRFGGSDPGDVPLTARVKALASTLTEHKFGRYAKGAA